MKNEERTINFEKFIDYVQNNYRQKLNDIDYELLNEIANNYNKRDIFDALKYCKKRSNSLLYLIDALENEYYKESKSENLIPSWFEEDLKPEPLDDEDIKWLEDFHKRHSN